ncbi:MAG TPA: threonine synthase [Bacillota bacterium]|nr:threonine synthase [Bacillota bacterium]HOL08691.1 threonine synthase [Bacillota bacterium]HPO96406.1 threonine synthase [Bacillota bacterium]
MNYISTRGDKLKVSAAAAIRFGLAPDGGLFTPETIPQLSNDTLKTLLNMDYQELATTILGLFLTDYDTARLKEMIGAAYAYPDKFSSAKVTPVSKLSDNQYLLELWHGPTCAFKDVALQLLPYLLTEANQITNNFKEVVILVATSGDTGKAALEGFKDVPGTKIIVFFPEDGVSEIQRAQMVTQEGQNTYVVAVKGNFDDAQNGVKKVFTDDLIKQLLEKNNMSFSSANSINWGRLAPQIVYYFFGYFEMCRQGAIEFGKPINISVPTGNFGNILAGYFAKTMGLPINKMICASNSNNVLTDFINTGVYNRNRQFYTTISPSMDILISSNLERLLFYISGQNHDLVAGWMNQLKDNGTYQVDSEASAKIKELFYGGYATEDATMDTIKTVFETTGMVIDTHTAVGQYVCEQYQRETGDQTPVLIASTASPFKFNSSVIKALKGEGVIAAQSEFELLKKLHEISGLTIPASLNELTDKPILHQRSCEREQMANVVKEILKLD